MDKAAARIRRIPITTIKKIIGDPEGSAKAVSLVYVNDSQEGIRRIRAGRGFKFIYRNKKVKDKETIQRIRSLVIPPAWENVWICAKENGHLQVTGTDIKGRKQYRYHPRWNQLRNQSKFYRMTDFGRSLPRIRKQLRKDLALRALCREKVLATIVSLMERTSIRIGNEEYEKANGSIGLTTMKNRHVELKGSSLKFSFIGKKGKEHRISLQNERLSKIVRHCREIPGKELFQYYDEDGGRQTVDSGMVNEYIREISGADFTAKDFRTWAGTVQCLLGLKESGPAENVTAAKKKFLEVLDKVAAHLGNTRAVCKKYYVHPCLGELFEANKLQHFFENDKPAKKRGLSSAEELVLKIISSVK